VNGPIGIGWSAWPAPAKLNLFLRIVGRRADGYHQLQTVFQLLDWGDTVHLRLRADDRIRRIGEATYGVAEQDDIVISSAKLLQSSAKIRKGVDIFVEKRIPVGGGFGGGSSDAATVLVALNRLWSAGLAIDDLAGLGLRLGADVPVFVRGDNAWAEGVGEQLSPLCLPPAWYVVVDPGVSVPTAELFQAPDLTRNARPATISDFVSGAALGNAFEPVLRARQPEVDAAMVELGRFAPACLTGTGSGCFARFATLEAANAALASLPAGLRACVVKGADRSALLDALSAYAPSGASSGG